MHSKSIAIVGGGATALSFLHSLQLEAASMSGCQLRTIYVLEKRRLKGRGLAYDADMSTNLLNTRAGFISPFVDKPGHFFSWLTTHRTLWEDEFPGLDIAQDTFAPRPLFGLYLEYMMSDLAGEFAAIGIQLIQMRAEVLEVHRTADSRCAAVTDTGLHLTIDHVVLSCGNLQSRNDGDLAGRQGYHASPYPISRLARAVCGSSRVAIIGARLSAIDVALGLAGAGYEGQMTMISRSGYFPSVRGTQGRYQPQILTREHLRRHFETRGKIRLAQLVEWVMHELHLAGSPPVVLDRLPPPPPDDICAYLEGEIAAADHARPWQAVLYATNTIIDYVWHILDEGDREEFLRRYAAVWMSYRVSIPAENAQAILSLIRSGRLEFRRGAVAVSVGREPGFDLSFSDRTQGRKEERFDHVVAAFGTPRNADDLESPLVQSLLEVGLARAHRHGGLDVEPQTNALVDGHGNVSAQISVLGELTAGVNFFTSALEINARHAARLAERLVAQHLSAPVSLAETLLPPLASASIVLERGALRSQPEPLQ